MVKHILTIDECNDIALMIAVDYLRKLGLVLEIEDGRVMLRTEYTAAREGEPLSAEQAKALEYLKRTTATFKIRPLSFWSKGQYEDLA